MKAAAEKRVQAEKAAKDAATLGVIVEVDPGMALLHEVWRTAAAVAWLEERVRATPQDRLIRMGAFGPSYDPMLKLWHQERDRLAKVAKAALDAGVAQARLDVARLYADRMGAVIDGLVRALGHDPEAPEVRQAVHRQLTLLQGGAA